MNAEQKALLQTMQILIDSKLDKVGCNYYLSGIVSALNEDGTCDIICSDHIYSRVRPRNGLALNVGDAVQVLIKNGDFNQKFIDDKLYHDPNYIGYSRAPDSVAIGTINLFTSGVMPEGWLLCDGRAVSRLEYAELFSVIGTTFGTGNGSTTFALPDLRGRVAAGRDSSSDFATIGKSGGEKTHTLTTAEMPSHTHIQNGHGHNVVYYSNGKGVALDAGDRGGYKLSWTADAGSSQGNVIARNVIATNQNTGGGSAHNNLPPYLTVHYIIKAKNPVNNLSFTPSHIVDHLASSSDTDVLSANMGRVLDEKIQQATPAAHLTMYDLPLNGAAGTAQYGKTREGVVILEFNNVTLNTPPASYNTFIIATMPAGYRPQNYKQGVLVQSDNGYQTKPSVCSIFIRPNTGQVAIAPANTTSRYLYGSIVYMLEP